MIIFPIKVNIQIMMKKDLDKILLLLFLILFLLNISCKQAKVVYGTEIDTKDSTISVRKLVNHKLTEEIIYYYPNKELKSKTNFLNRKRHGVYVEYYKNGLIKIKGTYKNGYQIGENILYSPLGVIEGLKIIESDSFQGEIFNYYPNKSKRLYGLSDFDSEYYYAIKWDSLGVKYYDEGVVFSPSLKCSHNLDSIPSNTPVEFYSAVSLFDKYNTIMKAGPNIKELNQLPLDRHKTTYRASFSKLGKDEVVFVGVMLDSLGKVIKADTTILQINVIR